jgi:hypothetical protein
MISLARLAKKWALNAAHSFLSYNSYSGSHLQLLLRRGRLIGPLHLPQLVLSFSYLPILRGLIDLYLFEEFLVLQSAIHCVQGLENVLGRLMSAAFAVGFLYVQQSSIKRLNGSDILQLLPNTGD